MATANYVSGQILTAASLNASLNAKVDSDNAAITAGYLEGIDHIYVTGTNVSTSPTTGAMTVAGGLGVGGDINGGGKATFVGDITTSGGNVNAAKGNFSDVVTTSKKILGVNAANLLVNSSGEFGNLNWSSSVFAAGVGTLGQGPIFTNGSLITTAQKDTQRVNIGAGVALTISAEILASGVAAGRAYVSVEAFNSSNVSLGVIATATVANGVSAFAQASGTTPGATAYVNIYKGVDTSPNVPVAGLAFRRLKLEVGTSASLYSQEASISATASNTNGSLPLTVTGGTLTLTADQFTNQVIKLTGTLTSNQIIVVPATPHAFILQNQTTGNYTVTVQAAGQTPQSIVTQGESAVMFADGTGVYATASAVGPQLAGIYSYAINTTLTQVQMGAVVYMTGAGTTATLPLAASYPQGAGLIVVNSSTGTGSIAAQGSDTSDLTLPYATYAGDRFYFISDGVSSWKLVAWSNKSNPSFDGALNVAGSATLGSVTMTTGPLTFPDATVMNTAGVIDGEFLINTTGGTVNVTVAQAKSNTIFKVTGALTSNLTINFPAAAKVLTLQNNTTGAFTVTAKVTGQTPSTNVLQGSSGTLFTDTTGCYATSAASGIGFSDEFSNITTVALTHLGSYILVTTVGLTTTLPLASTYPAGKGVVIGNKSTGTTNLAFSGSDTHDLPSTMLAGDIYFAVSDGVSNWAIGWYSATQHLRITDITFADGTVQSTANSTTQPASTWYVPGTTDTVGQFADGDTAIRTGGFTAPFVTLIKNGLTLTRGQHYTLNSDGIHINFTDPLINNGVDSDQLEVQTKGVYNPSSTYLPSLPWLTPAAGATFIAYPHTVGFCWPILRGAFLISGTDYTEDATGFYLVGFAADGVEQYGMFNLNAINIANALPTNSPVIAAGPLTFADGTKQGTAAVGRNRLINGDFRVNQRNGAGGATPALGTSVYLVDRWYTWQAGAACLVQTVPNNPNYGDPSQGYYMRATGVAGNTSVNFGQRIESVDISDLVGKTVTLSFSTIRTLGGIVAVAVYTPTANDNWATNASSQQIANFTLTAGTWYRQVVTFTVPAGAKFGLQVEFDAPNLIAGDYFAITDVQLEAGNNPSPVFERRPYRDVLAACQRYFYNIATGQQYDAIVTGQTNGLQFGWKWPITMRINPAITTNINTSTFSNNVQPGSGQWNAVLQSIAWLTVSSGTMALNITPSQSGVNLYTTGAVFNVVPTQMALGTGIYLRADAEL